MSINRTRNILFVAAVAVGMALISACTSGQAAVSGITGPLVLRNGSVFTATGAEPIPNAAIVIEDGIITAVGPEAELDIPAGATVIDVEGRMILPGLIDTHTHVLNKLLIRDGKISQATLQTYLVRALKAGITTMRDLGTKYDNQENINNLRAVLNSFGNSIPTLILTGPIIAQADGPVVRTFSEQAYGVTTVEQAREITLRLAEAGVDQIKIALHMRPAMRPPVGDPPEEIAPSLSLEQVQAIVEVAHEHDLWVTAHVTDPREAYIALEAGVDELAHWPATTETLPEDLLVSLVDKGLPVVSTFNIVPPQDGDGRRFLDAGGTLIFGTDAPGTGSPGNPYREFDRMINAGMSPVEMILSATIHAARAVGLGDRVGTLEAGKQADIIVVDGNPFENFNVMEDVIYVIKGGELVVRPDAKEK